MESSLNPVTKFEIEAEAARPKIEFITEQEIEPRLDEKMVCSTQLMVKGFQALSKRTPGRMRLFLAIDGEKLAVSPADARKRSSGTLKISFITRDTFHRVTQDGNFSIIVD
jgi:hypothetical protein